jgi:hypothetical protein
MSGIINSVGSKSGIVGSDVYPAGHVIDTKIYRIRDIDYYQSTSGTYKVCTAISNSSTGQLSFSAVAGNTYIITYQQFQQGYRNSGVDTSTRYWHGSMQVKNADITIGTTNAGGQTLSGGYIISGGIWGRETVANYGGGANSWVITTYVGGHYATVTETLYVYLTSSPPAAYHKIRSMCTDDYPSNCVIKTIKGNALTIS